MTKIGNGMLVRNMMELGMCMANISSAASVTNNLGGTVECTVSDNSYAITFPGFRETPLIFISPSGDGDTAMVQVLSKSTSTCLVKPQTFIETGGTATNADFSIWVIGNASL